MASRLYGLRTICFLLLLLLVCTTAPVAAQSTAFTYQGKLTDSGNPANGSYDLQFKLFDALSGGTQQGTTQTATNVTVTNGIFTVSLDFGVCAGCFNGAARFLEIAVKPTGGGSFTTLSPRQQITSTPYAVKSLNATTADGLSVACISCVTSSQIQSVNGSAVTGTIPVASVPAGSGNYVQNGTSQQTSSNFNVSGTGTANILNAATQFNLNGSRVLSTAGGSNLFAGLNAGNNNTSGGNNSFFGTQAGLSNTTGAGNVFLGIAAGSGNTVGNFNTFIGASADFNISNPTGNNNTLLGFASRVTSGVSNGTAIGVNASVTQSNSLILGSINGVNGATTDTKVGIGTTTPSTKLEVVDPVRQLRFGPTTADNGGYLISTVPHQAIISGGGKFDAPNWIARDTVASLTANQFGAVEFYTDSGLTVGNTFTPSLRMRINEFGRVSIGTASATFIAEKLHIEGGDDTGLKSISITNVGVIGESRDTVAVRGASTNGIGVYGVTFNSASYAGYFQGRVIANSYELVSDARLKQDISKLGYGLAEVLRLRPVSWRWKAHPESGGQLGLVAQEVEAVLPELVSTSKDAEQKKGLNYTGLIPVLVNAMQQQQQQLEQQQTQDRQQQTQLAAQQTQIKQQQGDLAALQQQLRQVKQQREVIRQQQQEMAAIKQLLCASRPKASICKAKALK